jgi:hypothetical protein
MLRSDRVKLQNKVQENCPFFVSMEYVFQLQKNDRWLYLSETRGCSITIAFQLCFRICHQEGPRKYRGTGIQLNTSVSGLC